MTGTTRSSAGLETRRRRALFRAWHRGTREMDLLLGGFADTHIADLDEAGLAAFEALLDVPDDLLFGQITGQHSVTHGSATDLLLSIRRFHLGRREQGT